MESYSHDLEVEGAIEITEQDFNEHLASLPAPVKVDHKAMWATATTQAQKLSVLAKVLNLE